MSGHQLHAKMLNMISYHANENTTVRSHYKDTRIAKIKREIISSVEEDVEQIEFSLTGGGNVCKW